MFRISLTFLAILLLILGLPFTAAATRLPWKQEPRRSAAARSVPAAVSLANGSLSPLANGDGSWTGSVLSLGERYWHTAVWDEAAGRMLVFGGRRWAPDQILNDLWSYHPASNVWTHLTPAGPLPPDRHMHSAVWDSINARMLIFGGAAWPPMNDLWSYSPGSNVWTQLQSAPTGRYGHSAVWDEAGGRMLIFGGVGRCSPNGVCQNEDTASRLMSYSTVDNNWTSLGAGGPGLSKHTAVWNAAEGRMLVFGGLGDGCGSSSTYDSEYRVCSDLWSYDAATKGWTKMSGRGPRGGGGKSAVWDTVHSRMLIFGGYMVETRQGRDNIPEEIWGFSHDLLSYEPTNDAWSKLSSSGDAESRGQHSAVWDTAGARMIIFGGRGLRGNFYGGGSQLDIPWFYSSASNAWSSPSVPERRKEHSAVWDAAGSRMLVFGGSASECFCTYPGNLWSYTPATKVWASLPVRGPGSREGQSAVWDTTGARMLVFGGYGWRDQTDQSSSPAYRADLWSYSPASNSWAHADIPPAGAQPPRRTEHSAVWDEAGARMLVFGGYSGPPNSNARSYLADLWSYSPTSNTWTQLSPSGSPPAARAGHSAVWDAAGARMLVFGGYNGSYLADLWSYSPANNAWTQLSPSGSPPSAREQHSAVWDAAGARMLVFGGKDSNGIMKGLWSYSPGANAWALLAPAGSRPAAHAGHSAVWDAAGSRMLVFGGQNYDGGNVLWQYTMGPSVSFSPAVAFPGGSITVSGAGFGAGSVTVRLLNAADDTVVDTIGSAAVAGGNFGPAGFTLPEALPAGNYRVSADDGTTAAVSGVPLTVTVPPTIGGPAEGATLPGLQVTLDWTNPPGTTQHQVQVVPANNDGPGINLIRGAETNLTLAAPVRGQGNYILLPGMTYQWQVRFTTKPGFAPESDPAWGPWSAPRSFRTPQPSSAGLVAVEPADGAGNVPAGIVTLRWDHPSPSLFYWELQVSGDARFDPDPATATSFVWWNLVHGGATTPLNSWRTPALEAGKTYYWRVRPRVQGDGAPVEWGPAWSFTAGTALAPAAPPTPAALSLTSNVFPGGGTIPVRYTCDGQDLSPALTWSGGPTNARAFALIMDDPDAPGRSFTHWVIYNLPAGQRSLAEGVSKTERLDNGALQGSNDFGGIGYGGPCPPPGPAHSYRFTLYALDAALSLAPRATNQQVTSAMQGHVLAQAQMSGKYGR